MRESDHPTVEELNAMDEDMSWRRGEDGCGDVWADHDYPARERKPSTCPDCGGGLVLRHVCDTHIVIRRSAVVDAIQWRDWDAVRDWLTFTVHAGECW